MKASSTLLFLIITFSFSINIHSQGNNNSSYFPIAIDNEWEFSSQLFPVSEKFTNTLRINNKLYYGLSVQNLNPYLFFRKSGSQVFVFNPNDSLEYVLYDFNAKVGESWKLPEYFNCSYGLEIALIGNNDTVDTPLGTFYNCLHFRHSQICMDAGIVDTWFAKGIGKVKYIEVYFVGMGDFVLEDYNIVTSTDKPHEKPRINSFSLSQNYPNPFNPTTKISWQSSIRSWQTLKVYNVLGKEIKTLVDEERPVGKHEVEFDGTSLPSGIYFYQLKAGNYVKTKKMILMK